MNTNDPDPESDPDSVARLLRERLRSTQLELPVHGSSMLGTIDSDSVVTIIWSDRPRRGQVWVFVDDDGHMVVHRIRHLDNQTVIARGVGNRFDDPPVERTRLIGRVVHSRGPGGVRRFGTVDRMTSAAILRGRRFARLIGLRRGRRPPAR